MTERDIFLAVLDLPDPAARAAYLDAACGGDAARRARVEALLRSHEAAGSFLAEPAVAPPDAGATKVFAGTAAPDHGDESLPFLAPPRRPDSLGRIGHYEVLEVLGRGGFGIVFRAFDEVLQRVVAVKVLAPHVAATSPARKRFLREARSSAQVRHENVVQTHAVEEQPLPYLVMEFIPGETLQERLNRTGPLDVPEVLRVGRQIAEGLAAAHAQGLIHRDIKPANVLVEGGPPGRVKLTDFGLARAADDASISQSGVLAGTPTYMAPEQAKGEALDHRADLFSLGSVLYVMCCGRPPFRASGTMAVLKRVCEDEPRPIREVIPEVPDWLCRIVGKLHAKDPAERFQTAREVADVLADCETQWKAHGAMKDFSRVPGGTPLRPQHRRLALVVGSLALLYLLAWAWAVWPGPYARRYLGNRGEVVFMPEPGWVSTIVWRDGHAVTDWYGVAKNPTIALPPGKYELKPGFAPGRTIQHWEVTVSGLFSSRASLHGSRDFEVEVARGERATIRAVMRDDPSTLPAPVPVPSDAGWVPLFNGKDLAGWKRHPKWRGAWSVETGTLVGRNGLTFLLSERDDYANFRLRAEMRSSGGTGVYFRATDPAQDYPLGWVADTTLFKIHRCTPDWKAVPTVDSVAVPANQWFTLEVVAVGDQIAMKVDGKTVVDYVIDRPGAQKGLLALHAHQGGEIRFRKLEIKELPPSASTVPAIVLPLRDLVAAKKRSLEATKIKVEAGSVSGLDLAVAEAELAEARARLARAEGDRAAERARLQDLVTHRRQERDLKAVLVEVGRERPDVLDQADARLKDAEARLAEAGLDPPPTAPKQPTRQ